MILIAIIPIMEYNILWVFCNILICKFIGMRWQMNCLTSAELSEKWNISSRRIGVLCTEGRIEGAVKKGKMWLIPDDAQKPADARMKVNKQDKEKNDAK